MNYTTTSKIEKLLEKPLVIITIGITAVLIMFYICKTVINKILEETANPEQNPEQNTEHA